MKKMIGIIARPYIDKDGTKYMGINENIRKSIIKKNCIPLIINSVDYYSIEKKLSTIEKNFYKKIIDMCSGIIITGGSYWYNYDIFILKYAIKKDVPVLGICMGMQLMASLFTNDDNIELNNSNINHHDLHEIFINDNTILKKIINTNKIIVNSRHSYHIKKANNFIISATSPDNLIEAIEMPNKKCVIGLQWHPEDMLDYDTNANKIYDFFINKL